MTGIEREWRTVKINVFLYVSIKYYHVVIETHFAHAKWHRLHWFPIHLKTYLHPLCSSSSHSLAFIVHKTILSMPIIHRLPKIEPNTPRIICRPILLPIDRAALFIIASPTDCRDRPPADSRRLGLALAVFPFPIREDVASSLIACAASARCFQHFVGRVSVDPASSYRLRTGERAITVWRSFNR